MSVDFQLKKMSRNFVSNVNTIRKLNRLSYRGMGRETGLSDSTIRRMEIARKTRYGKGEQGYNPSLSTVLKVARAIDRDPSDILEFRL